MGHLCVAKTARKNFGSYKIMQFLFLGNQHGREKRENLHHVKISRYTVFLPDVTSCSVVNGRC